MILTTYLDPLKALNITQFSKDWHFPSQRHSQRSKIGIHINLKKVSHGLVPSG